jgi:hypothetical protein
LADLATNAVTLSLVPVDDTRRAAYNVPAVPGTPPCELFLSIGHDGKIVSVQILQADRRMGRPLVNRTSGCAVARYLAQEDVAEIVFQTGTLTSRYVTFDWPGDAPKWMTTAELDDSGRLLRIVVLGASLRLRDGILNAEVTEPDGQH